jgi:hypothetical protein
MMNRGIFIRFAPQLWNGTMEKWSIELGMIVMSGAEIGVGLKDAEVSRIEDYWQFRFPPDLRELLQIVLPLPPRFPPWRNFASEEMKQQMDWPADGLCFDVEFDAFWLEAWGERPASLDEAFVIARANVAAAPKLIPIYGHRYIPAQPSEAGNPVFSVYQTDIIYYGADLSRYIMTEFGELPYAAAVENISKRIPFWSDLVDR